jgi:hypothetical protein
MWHPLTTSIILVCGIAIYPIMSLYLIGRILFPLLTTAVNGVIGLARQAVGMPGNSG